MHGRVRVCLWWVSLRWFVGVDVLGGSCVTAVALVGAGVSVPECAGVGDELADVLLVPVALAFRFHVFPSFCLTGFLPIPRQ